MATLSGLILTLTQTEAQQTLKIVGVSYGYTLICTDGEAEQALSFDVSIDILGNDLLRDDVLASGVDRHLVECGGTDPIKMRRSLLVGQSLLDEDIGTDEIKLRICVRDSSGGEASAFTGIVRGNF